MPGCETTRCMRCHRTTVPRRLVVHFRNRCASFVRGLARGSACQRASPRDPVDCAQGQAAHQRERLLPTVGRNMRKVSWRAKLREGALSLLALTTLVSILYVADVR